MDGNRGPAQSLALRVSPAEAKLPEEDGVIASLADVWSDAPRIRLRYSRALATPVPDVASRDEHEPAPAEEPAPVLHQHAFTVRPGDSLYTLFKAEGLERKDLAAIMAAGKSTSMQCLSNSMR